jgi:ComF family protein
MAARALTPLIDLVFPPRCPLCGEPLAAQGGLCIACWGQLVIPGEPACAACQRPLEEPAALAEDRALCRLCLRHPPQHDGLTAATLYTGASRDLVLRFKHGRRIALADLLARLMAARLPPLAGEWIVVPVPLHRWRLWRRGFNQSALLARLLAQAPGRRLVVDALVRQRATPTLGGLDREQRRRALAGSLAVHPRRAAALAGAQVLLVDDVVTSGATTDAATLALRRAGARSVRIACFARVLDEAL